MDASRSRPGNLVAKAAAAAVQVGEVHQLADGRAGVLVGGNAATTGQATEWYTDGVYSMPKAAGYALLDGGHAYWDKSASVVSFRHQSDGDFFLGAVHGDVDGDAVSVSVNLNVRPAYEVELGNGVWTTEATDGLGVSDLVGAGGVKLAFDAVAEVAQAAIYSARTFPKTSNPILECRIAVVDNGDNAALDIDVGLANGSHATDFEAVTEFVSFHLDGNDLDLDTQSDDGTTDVAPDDTGVDLVEGTYVELWIDCRNPNDVQMYADGVLVNAATVHTLAAAVGPLKPIVHMEKTSDDTPAEVRVDFLRVRTAEQ